MSIFNDDFDYKRFQVLLYIINSKETGKLSDIIKSPHPVWEMERGETLVNIGAYCLMPNHFHIILKVKDKENTAIFLQRLQMGYSKYFNIKNDRSGSLFQGKSKAEHIGKDLYFKYLFSYIHLNPVKLIQKNWKEDGINDIDYVKQYLSEYKYSSYIDFSKTDRSESKILEKQEFPDYFPTKESFDKEIFEWLNYNKNEAQQDQQ